MTVFIVVVSVIVVIAVTAVALFCFFKLMEEYLLESEEVRT